MHLTIITDYDAIMAPNADIQIDWTVSRCNRLMRPFVTRIQKLRIIKNENQISRRVSRNANSNKTVNPSSKRDNSEERSPTQEKENDPDWISGPKKKKARREYFSRSASAKDHVDEIGVQTPARGNDRSRLQPGELSILTPYLVRLPTMIDSSVQNDNTNVDQDPSATNTSTNQPKPKTYRRPAIGACFGQQHDPVLQNLRDEFVLASNVGKCFLDIMNATNGSIDPEEQNTSCPSRGARSLWATCLRKYGTLIQDDVAEEESDPVEGFAYATYELVEDLPIPERKPGGHLQLRLVVRAHALQTMATTIEEGLFPREAVRLIISELLNPPQYQTAQPSRAEAEVLMSALIVAEKPKNVSNCATAHRNHFYAHTFSNAASQAAHVGESRVAFEFRQFSKVLRSSYVPIEWMATRRVMPLWTNVFRTFLDSSSSDDIRDGYELLRQTVEFAVGLEPSSRSAEKVLLEVPADYVERSESCPKCPRAPFGSFLVNPTASQPLPASDRCLAKNQLTSALTNTISSLSTLLSSFAIACIVNPVGLANVNLHSILSVLNMLSLEITMYHARSSNLSAQLAHGVDRPYSIVPDSKRSQLFARRAVCILASTLITKVAGCPMADGFGSVSLDDLVYTMKKLDSSTRNDSADPTTILDCLPQLVCSIARGASRLLEKESFDTLSNIVRSLASPNLAGQKLSSSILLFLKQLAFSSAHHFIDETKDPAHYSLIDEVEREMGHTEYLDVNKTPFRSSTKTRTEPRGFKWEEGICEWVLATPKPGQYKEVAFKDTAPDELLGDVPLPDPSIDLPPLLFSSPTLGSSLAGFQSAVDESSLTGSQSAVNISSLLLGSNSSSPVQASHIDTGVRIASTMPAMFGKNKRRINELKEGQRVKNLNPNVIHLPILKRAITSDDSSDDELGWSNNQYRKRAACSGRHSGPADHIKVNNLRQVDRDDSEDELSFV
jgi:hypothetical protein